jgi:hypothetical protein
MGDMPQWTLLTCLKARAFDTVLSASKMLIENEISMGETNEWLQS